MALKLETCNVKEVCASLGESEELLIELRDKLREWLKLQPHLPQDTSERRLEWFILGTKLSLERAKQKLDMYYTLRRHIPEIYANRDPRQPSLTSAHNSMQYVVLPKLTPEKYRTMILRLTQSDSKHFCPWLVHKYMFMINDILMHEVHHSGFEMIYDLSLFSLSHFMKITPTLVKKCETVSTQAQAARIKGIFLINAPPFVDRILTMIKSVLKPKLAARLHVHVAGDLESLHKFVPKSILPADYGGDESTMDELSVLWRAKIDSYRDWFLEDQKLLVDERLRPGAAFDADSLFGFSGSFRKLNVD